MDHTPQEPEPTFDLDEHPDNNPNTMSDEHNHRYDEEANVEPLDV